MTTHPIEVMPLAISWVSLNIARRTKTKSTYCEALHEHANHEHPGRRFVFAREPRSSKVTPASPAPGMWWELVKHLAKRIGKKGKGERVALVPTQANRFIERPFKLDDEPEDQDAEDGGLASSGGGRRGRGDGDRRGKAV